MPVDTALEAAQRSLIGHRARPILLSHFWEPRRVLTAYLPLPCMTRSLETGNLSVDCETMEPVDKSRVRPLCQDEREYIISKMKPHEKLFALRCPPTPPPPRTSPLATCGPAPSTLMSLSSPSTPAEFPKKGWGYVRDVQTETGVGVGGGGGGNTTDRQTDRQR